jgi:arginyl-tRNA synthetase
MKPVIDILEDRINAAMDRCTGRKGCAAIVKPATDPKFGDYQVNGVMPLAKQLKTNPRKLAENVLKNLDISDICEQPEVAGPGFINLRLKVEFVAANLLEINKDADRLGIEKDDKPKNIVVDFSGPNIAKEMHVGHLRSTIIGDCICRLLEFLGHKVIRQNHIGDWGLQMGMVAYAVNHFAYRKETEEKPPWIGRPSEDREWPTQTLELDTLEDYYKKVTKLTEEDAEVEEAVRKCTVDLQSGDRWTIGNWKIARETTLKACFEIYDKFGVIFKGDEIRGESFYKDMLADVVKELKDKNLAVESEGAICVFPEGFKDKEGNPLPVIVQKSDGAYLYATTDLAALRWRTGALKADKIIYVTDARQSLHFQMVFAVAKMASWAKNTELVHITFGSVLGEDGKPLKTRSGENVKLKELLDEAVERARKIVDEKNPELSESQRAEIAKAVGIGAVKYADFSNNRTSDYVFSFDKMLAMDGNTAPYMQYAHARIKSIERKGKDRGIDVESERSKVEKANLTEPAELDLAKHLIRYGEAVQAVAADYRPNYLTAYLYELAQKFSVFYTNCPVLDAGQDKRPTRLLLCDLTAKTIKQGLSELLGIEVLEQM